MESVGIMVADRRRKNKKITNTTKAMVSAWALKQGFDAAIIAPVLGALQTGDLGQLAAQGVKLAGVAELSDQQVQILNGVLSNYGIDAKAGEVLNSVKGLFGR